VAANARVALIFTEAEHRPPEPTLHE